MVCADATGVDGGGDKGFNAIRGHYPNHRRSCAYVVMGELLIYQCHESCIRYKSDFYVLWWTCESANARLVMLYSLKDVILC